MTGEEQYTILQEVIDTLPPSAAKKMEVMFGHIFHSDGTMSEEMARNFYLTAATLIDEYTLVGGKFNKSQRAMMAAMVLEAMKTRNLN